MDQTCANTWCGKPFAVTDTDRDFLRRLAFGRGEVKQPIPEPTRCPDCRLQRRAAWRNERTLFRRTCSLCGSSIVAMYPTETPFPVFCSPCFFGDKWNPTAVGRPFSDAPFLSQFQDLQGVAPRIALLAKNSENSDFTNHSGNNRDCYLSTAVFSSEGVLYSRYVFDSSNIVDSSFVLGHCELLYDCVWVSNAYRSTHLIDCAGVNDCHCCIDCRGCSKCFLCSNLRNAAYHFQNMPMSKADYERTVREYIGTYSGQQRALETFDALQQKATVYRNVHQTSCEACFGDYLLQCKNVYRCFDMGQAEDIRYCVDCGLSAGSRVSRTCMDCFSFNSSDFLYEVQAQVNGYGNVGNNFSYDVRHCAYIDNCHNVRDCVGCIGMKDARFCILNKQYTEEEYDALLPPIIERMRRDGEWGECFPAALSPFAYNDTMAQEYCPITEADAGERGWHWKERPESTVRIEKIMPTTRLPDSIDEVIDSVTEWAITCEATKRPFKMTHAELQFYRQTRIPLPRLHPDERHRRRMALKNPRTFWRRPCMQCGAEMETTYPPSRPEVVYCGSCYSAAVY